MSAILSCHDIPQAGNVPHSSEQPNSRYFLATATAAYFAGGAVARSKRVEPLTAFRFGLVAGACAYAALPPVAVFGVALVVAAGAVGYAQNYGNSSQPKVPVLPHKELNASQPRPTLVQHAQGDADELWEIREVAQRLGVTPWEAQKLIRSFRCPKKPQDGRSPLEPGLRTVRRSRQPTFQFKSP